MQRVRIGLTGLAFVFLAVLLAAIFTGQTRNETPITANLAEPSRGTPPAQPPAPRETCEPLAQLGVAPGADANCAPAQPAAPPPAPRR
jgi:hypothetical protein